MSNVHWTSLSYNLSFQIFFLFQSFLAITVYNKEILDFSFFIFNLKKNTIAWLTFKNIIILYSVWFTFFPFNKVQIWKM